jgi:acetyl esterase/lipase
MRLTLLMLGFALLLSGVYLVSKRSGLFLQRPDQEITYKSIDGDRIALHVFKPHGSPGTGTTPVLLFFHGGAWQYGNPNQFFPQCRHFSALGLTCISAAYRIASVHGTSPEEALQDARDAIRYIRRNARLLGIDPAKVVASGGSAGGHLAAALGTAVNLPDPGFDPQIPVRPNALVLYNPMLNLAPGMPDHELVGERWHDVSPFHHIDDLVPPTLILSGSADLEVSVSTVNAFCQSVQKRGGVCDAVIYQGAGHGFFNPENGQGHHFRLTNEAVTGFLKRLGCL